MKTQSFGRSASRNFIAIQPTASEIYPEFHPFSALQDYRKKRENGEEIDNPKEVFPSAGLDNLDIEKSDRQESQKWPDKDGRKWLKLTCKNTMIECYSIKIKSPLPNVIYDFYYMKDKSRGYPDASGTYWFSIHHAPSNTKMEGFSMRQDKGKNYPNKNGSHWSHIRYDECGPIKEWMEEKDKNYEVRLNHLEEENKEQSVKIKKLEKSLEQEKLDREKAQALSYAKENALTEERLQAHQWEKLAHRLEAEQVLAYEESTPKPFLNAQIIQVGGGNSHSGCADSCRSGSLLSGLFGSGAGFFQPSLAPSAFDEEEPLPEEPPEELVIAQAKHDYQAKNQSQLSFNKGDTIVVLEQQGNWWACELDGRQGRAPRNYLSIIPQQSQEIGPPSSGCSATSLS